MMFCSQGRGDMPSDNEGLDFVFANSEEIIARQEIRVDPGDLGPATKSAIAALAREPNPLAAIYVNARRLVFPARLHSELNAGGIKRPDHALALHGADREVVALRLTRVAQFLKSTKKGPPREVDPPERICNTVIASRPWDGLPLLTGIIEAPTILPSGRLIQEPGYDPGSGLLFDPGATRFPTIPERPTRDDANAALDFLSRPLEKFPFIDDTARAVALAAILTALVRRGLRAAPIFCYSAPKPASGKTLLATLPAYIVTGREPYTMPPVDDPNEERKRLLATLSECPAVILIDNIDRPFRSASMCIALTEPTFADRVLGSTENRAAHTNCLFVATGNNLVLAGDLSSRGLKCEIDPEVENPEERGFDVDLHEWVPANRRQLAAAALTIIAAYIAEGEPRQDIPNFARFEQWQRLCRFPLTWLGCADPCASRQKVASADPVQVRLTALLLAWNVCFGDDRKSIKQAIKPTENAADGSAAALLRESMEAVASERGGVNTRRLGNFISAHERRIEGGLRFERDGTAHGVILWKVADPTQKGANGSVDRGFGGLGGFRPSPAGKEGGDFYGNSVGTNPPDPPNRQPNSLPNSHDDQSDDEPPTIPGGIDLFDV
jgi:putative DNA primase/helicase